MVNFNVNPSKTNKTPEIIKPENAISWSNIVYGYYDTSGNAKAGYSSLYDAKNGQNIIISQTVYDPTLGYYVEPSNSNLAFQFYYTFPEKYDGIKPVSLIDIPQGNYHQFPVWDGNNKTWLFSNVVRHLILVIGPIGVSVDPNAENGIVTTTLKFSEDFILLNDPDLYASTNTTHTNNSITSNGAYAILYFPQLINRLTIENSHLEPYADETYTYQTLGSLIQFGTINNLAIFGLDTNVRESKQVTFNIDNNTYDHELITNPVPFEIPEFNYHDYDSRKLVKFNIFEKE